MRRFSRWLLVLAMLSLTVSAAASDHADPIRLSHNEAGITDLYAFSSPDGQSLVLALCAGRGLTDERQLPLRPIEYHLRVDCTRRVEVNDSKTRDRYGGRVVHPDRIQEDVQLTFRLNNDGSLNQRVCEPESFASELSEPFCGFRDDPFIFHRFHTTNVVAIVQEIPWDSLPRQSPDASDDVVLVWATSDRFSEQIDHVGRSLRTMLPRFDFLNQVEPRRHVEILRQRHERPGVVTDLLATFASPFFGIRHYDFQPDVLIYDRRRPARYPNGRALEDDVADLCCQQGDCLLYEVSLAEAEADHVRRPTENNVNFLDEFPYLAPPNADSIALADPSLTARTKCLIAAAVLLLAGFLLLPWVLLYFARRQIRRLTRSFR
ncbi:MAG: hypothetical protein AAGC97_16900 [Planctomycetota bacterium]